MAKSSSVHLLLTISTLKQQENLKTATIKWWHTIYWYSKINLKTKAYIHSYWNKTKEQVYKTSTYEKLKNKKNTAINQQFVLYFVEECVFLSPGKCTTQLNVVVLAQRNTIFKLKSNITKTTKIRVQFLYNFIKHLK